jgi:hypothetical protein
MPPESNRPLQMGVEPQSPRWAWSGRAVRLMLVSLVALIAALATLTDVVPPLLRLLLAVPLVVIIPGYALVAASCSEASISGAERLALSIGTSLALAVLGGLLLNWTPWGLQPASWGGLLSTFTIVAAAIALARERQRPTPVAVQPAPLRAGLGVGSAFVLASAVAIHVGTVYLARASAAMSAEDGFTQIWMLPTPEAAPTSVRLGVKSLETTEETYAVRLDIDGAPALTWTSIVLAPGASWETTTDIPAEASGATVAEARLYRATGQPIPDEELNNPSLAYRRVVLRR